jgi:hypothetical protein
MSKSYDRVREWRKNTKSKLVEGFGSKCSICKIQDDPVIYDFHHLDSEQKDFQLSSKVMSWDKLIIEAKKCVMLCSHCHRKLHFRNLVVENPIPFDETKITSEKNNRWGFK